MNKFSKVVVLSIFLILFFFLPGIIFSAPPENCVLKINSKPASEKIQERSMSTMQFEFNISTTRNNFPNDNYDFAFPGSRIICGIGRFKTCGAAVSGQTASITIDSSRAYESGFKTVGVHSVELIHESGVKACNTVNYEIIPIPQQPCTITFVSSNSVCDVDSNITLHIESKDAMGRIRLLGRIKKEHGPESKTPLDWNVGKLVIGDYSIIVENWALDSVLCQGPLTIKKRGESTACIQIPTPTPTTTLTPTPTYTPLCNQCFMQADPCDTSCQQCPFCQPTATPAPIQPLPSLAPICDQLDPQYQGDCKACMDLHAPPPPNGRKGIWTAIGCVPTDLSTVIRDYVFKFGIGIAGGIAFLYFIYGAFMILTSAGNAERIEEAKQTIISALSGLLLIIFSLFILKFIGVDIFGIPGLGQ